MAADDPDSINLVTFDGASGVGRMNETDPLRTYSAASS